jgi:hypothetical protein
MYHVWQIMLPYNITTLLAHELGTFSKYEMALLNCLHKNIYSTYYFIFHSKEIHDETGRTGVM